MLTVLLQFAAALAPVALVLVYFCTHPNWRGIREAVWIAFGLGVVVAIPIAGAEYLVAIPFQSLTGEPLFSAIKALFIAAIPEETGKLLILVYLVMRHEDFSRPVHAIVLATSISLGFAAIENVLYVFEAADWAATALARSFTALPMHTAAGLVMGYFASLSITAMGQHSPYRILMLVLPVMLHAAYDFPVFVLASMGAFYGTPVDLTRSPYGLLFALALATCVGVMVTIALRMHHAGLPRAMVRAFLRS